MMKITFIFSFLFTLAIYGQPGPIKNLRYNDDFSYLLADTNVKKGTDKLKYISISKKRKDAYLHLGGEIREWYEIRKNSNFGDLPPGSIEDPNGSLQHRLMLHADLHLNNKLRFFIQLNNTLEFGNPNPTIPEIIVDGLGVHQLFVEINVTKNEKFNNNFRIGRQEFSFGNELLVSSREGPNNRQAFDGLSFIIQNQKMEWYVFTGTPIIINPEIFDNTHIPEVLWGTYGQLRAHKKNHLDLYYLGFYSERRQFNYVEGKQHRHTIGARFWKHSQTLYYDVELMYQTGTFNKQWINAINFTGELRYVFQNTFLKPMIGIGASYISGDYNSNDNQLNTFDPLYPKPVYGLATPQGPSNIAHVSPTAGIQPAEHFYINFRWYWLTRTSNMDGTYTPGMVQVRPFPENTSDKYKIGIQYGLDMFYVLNKHITLLSFMSYVEPGPYISETGAGKDVFFFAGMIQYKF